VTGGPPPVELLPAATVVVLRPAPGGLEVLLTRRPPSMRFGGGLYVFPGGRLEPGETAAAAAVRETLEETGIRLDPDALVPLTRWVTPRGLPLRFDARFFASIVPAGSDVVEPSDEIAEWRWLRPTAALEAMAAGALGMWQPTAVTLQQLEGAADAGELAARSRADRGPGGERDPDAPPLGREFETGWSGGVEGRRGVTSVVGRERWVVVDPGDPTGAVADAVRRAAAEASASLVGVLVTGLDPDRHAGVELFARGLGLAVAGPPGGDALATYRISELADGSPVPWTDEPLVVDVAPRTRAAHAGPPRWADRADRLRIRRVEA
jgi:8-oxo-dGTP pyrophosphatase MutT (NUDIX family)